MILEIQGLRAIAVLLVVAFHAGFISGGYIGVDIFYVISGYLITGLLLREFDRSGTISFRAFYARRLKRLLPSSFIVLFSTAVVGLVFMPASTRSSLGRDVMAGALYVSNYLFAWWQNDYQNLGATPSPVIHFWSLAVEEQFYLFWPMFIYFLLKRRKRETLFFWVASVTAISFLVSLYMTTKYPIWAFYSLPSRAWELGAGALILLSPARKVSGNLLLWLSFAGLAISATFFNSNTAFPGTAALLPVLSVTLIMYAVHAAARIPSVARVVLQSRVSQWLGAVSYPMYLWHWPVLVLPVAILGRPLTLVEKLGAIALTILLSGVTHRYVEERFRQGKYKPVKVYISATVATLVSVSLGIGIYSASATSIHITSGNSSTSFSLATITEKPIIYADGCQVDKSVTNSGPCEYGDRSSRKTWVLFGDSHAAQWFPTLNAIAVAQSVKLVVLTKSSCPSVSVDLPDRGAFKNAPCVAWRSNSIARINHLRPEVVFVSSFSHYLAPKGVTNVLTWWSAGESSLKERLLPSRAHVLSISDTPLPNSDIPTCLSSKKLSQCFALPSPVTTWKPSSDVINPKGWFCTSICPSVIDGLVAYRDTTHMSVQFALHLVKPLTSTLVSLGVLAP